MTSDCQHCGKPMRVDHTTGGRNRLYHDECKRLVKASHRMEAYYRQQGRSAVYKTRNNTTRPIIVVQPGQAAPDLWTRSDFDLYFSQLPAGTTYTMDGHKYTVPAVL